MKLTLGPSLNIENNPVEKVVNYKSGK